MPHWNLAQCSVHNDNLSMFVLIHICKYIQIVRQRLDQSVLSTETESQARGKSPTNPGTKLPTVATAVIVFVEIFFFLFQCIENSFFHIIC